MLNDSKLKFIISIIESKIKEESNRIEICKLRGVETSETYLLQLINLKEDVSLEIRIIEQVNSLCPD